MSIAPFAVPGVLAPLQGFWRWLVPATAPSGPAHANIDQCDGEFAMHSIAINNHRSRAEAVKTYSSSARRPLRIVRVLEANQAPSNVGRMLISGRMSEVCAELDRLAAREAAFH